MNALTRKVAYTMLSFLLLLPFGCGSQNVVQKKASDSTLIEAARAMMIAAGNCALITLDENERTAVRTMDPFPPENDLTVWFGTNPKSRKAAQIRKNPNVTLYYSDSDATGYVVIYGKAQLVTDQKEKNKRWKAEWKTFYPNQAEDYLLIKVTPERMEIISESRGILGDPVTWKPPVVVFDPE